MEELPFGTVSAMALKLLKDGHLRMLQAFDANASYGIFTGQQIMDSKNLSDTLMKFACFTMIATSLIISSHLNLSLMKKESSYKGALSSIVPRDIRRRR